MLSGSRCSNARRRSRASAVTAGTSAPAACSARTTSFRLFGVEPGSVTPTPECVFERVFADDVERVRRAIEHAAETGELGAIEYRIVRADGALRRMHATVASTEAEGGRGGRLVGAVQDVTERRQMAREVAGHIAMEEVLASWVTPDEGAVQLLTSFGEATGFSVGILWLRRGDDLIARSFWASANSREFPLDADTRLPVSARAQALAVQAWVSRAPVVVVDLADSPAFAGRGQLCARTAHGAVAFPAVSEDDVHAVLEFYSRERLQPTETLLRSLTGMGHALGHFLARRHGELHPPELTAREREILQLAANGMSGKAIAHELTLSPSTVKTHFEHIYAKWGRVGPSTAAVAKALRDGLIR